MTAHSSGAITEKVCRPRRRRIQGALKRLGTDENGATAIEYGLIITIMCGMLVVSLTTFSTYINENMNEVSSAVDDVRGD